MAIAITIPRLGWNMEEGVFVGWLKGDGEPIRAGDPLFTLEGEKATQDIEANDAGILRIPPAAPKDGERVAVGAVIGYLLGPGEADPVVGDAPVAEGRRAVAAASVASATSAAEPIERRVRRDRPRSSPLARRVARELGVDWTQLQGSGSTGRIRKVDVLGAVRDRAQARPAGAPPHPPRPDGAGPATPGRTVPIGSIRRTIAARMVESRRTTAPVTLTTTADATNLVNLRGQFQAVAPEGRDLPGYTDFLVKLTAMALREHPVLNARWDEDRLVIPDEP